MSDPSQLYESVLILNDHAEHILASLYNFKCIFENDSQVDSVWTPSVADAASTASTASNTAPDSPMKKIRLFNDARLQPIVKAAIKKFPDISEMAKVIWKASTLLT